MKNKPKITQPIAKSHDTPGKNSLSKITVSGKFLFSFLSYQPHFASCHQLGCYTRQSLSTCNKAQKKRYNYYINLFFYDSKESVQPFNH